MRENNFIKQFHYSCEVTLLGLPWIIRLLLSRGTPHNTKLLNYTAHWGFRARFSAVMV
jgi:hypothetical protein